MENTKTPQVNTERPTSRGKAPAGRRGGSRRPRAPRVKPEYEQKIISIRRVTRVMAGGRRFSFSVAMVIGNKNGVVGVGLGKASDTSLAIQKAYNNAKKNLVKVQLDEKKSIPFDVHAKYNSAQVMLMPNDARGLVAGSSIRIVLELLGAHDVTGKVHSRSKNQLNNARATVKALAPFSKPFRGTEKPVVTVVSKVGDDKATKASDSKKEEPKA